jgi:hypothetical protein
MLIRIDRRHRAAADLAFELIDGCKRGGAAASAVAAAVALGLGRQLRPHGDRKGRDRS